MLLSSQPDMKIHPLQTRLWGRGGWVPWPNNCTGEAQPFRNQENQSSEKDDEDSVDWCYIPLDKIWYRGGDLAETRKTELFMIATSHIRGDSEVIQPLYDFSPRLMLFLALQLYLPKSHACQAAEALPIHRLALAHFPHSLGSLIVSQGIGPTV